MAQLLSVTTFQFDASQQITSTFQAVNTDVVIAGNVQPASGHQMSAIISLSEVRARTWQKTISTPFGNLLAAIAEIGNATYMGVGTLSSSGDSADRNIWLVNYDNEGNELWQNVIGPAGEQGGGTAIAGTSDGGFVVTGFFIDSGSGDARTLVAKFDGNRNIQWQQTLEGGVAFAVVQTSTGGYMIAGGHTVAPGAGTVYAALLDGNGNVVWEKAYNDLEVLSLFKAGLVETSDGNFVIAAISALVKVDPNGDIVWAHRNAALGLQSVAQLSNGNLAVSGMLSLGSAHAYVAVLGSDGSTIIWDNTEISTISIMASVFMSTQGYLTAGGYVPLYITPGTSLMALAVYNPATSISS